MNSFRLALLGATFLIGAGAVSAANAADVYERGGSLKDGPVDYRPAISWAGFYAGVHAGSTFDDALDFDAGVAEASLEIDEAFIGGIQVGYNWQQSNLVLGIEGTLSLLDDDDLTDYLASVRGRIGYAAGKTLFYATGGVAFLDYNDDFADLLLDDEVAVGFVVGGGIEHKFTPNVSLGVEGSYYSFSSDTIDPTVDLDRDFWTVQARLNYHFGSRHDEPLK